MRALKEQMVVCPCEIKAPVDRYLLLVEAGLKELSRKEKRAYILRFWGLLSISQVADAMTLTWEEADRIIDTAVLKLRNVFKENL